MVLLGQDQNNQSAVVVLGDKEDRRDIGPGDDISAVIGERQTEYTHYVLFVIKCSEMEIRSGDVPCCLAGKITRPNFYLRIFYEAQLHSVQYGVSSYLMTMVPGQVVTNLSPSLQRGVARPGSTGDLFTRLLAAPDPGPVLVEDLPDVVKTAINPEHSVEQVRS